MNVSAINSTAGRLVSHANSSNLKSESVHVSSTQSKELNKNKMNKSINIFNVSTVVLLT